MTKWTDAKLKREAIRDWKESYECGHYPDWTNEPLSNQVVRKWAKEYNMSVPEFYKYADYFYQYEETRM